jgi:hypothetical protein
MCLCCCDGVELGDVIDIISLIIECILGKEFCFKGALKSSKNAFLYKFLFRFFCLLVGIGFDLGSFYINYPAFYSGYENTDSILEKYSGPFITQEKGFYFIAPKISDFNNLLKKTAAPLVVGSLFLFLITCPIFCITCDKTFKAIPGLMLKAFDFAWTLAVILVLLQSLPSPVHTSMWDPNEHLLVLKSPVKPCGQD